MLARLISDDLAVHT